MFFRREQPKEITFDQRMEGLRKAGFTVNPAQFSFRDGSFRDAGIVEPPSPRGHHVAAGAVYQFSVDYSALSHDPRAGKGTGGYVYAPAGHVLAVWGHR